MAEIRKGRYLSYDNAAVTVLGVAHAEDLSQELVIYQYTSGGLRFLSPAKFVGKVRSPGGRGASSGELVDRFTYVGP